MKNSYDCPSCGKKFVWDDESPEKTLVCASCNYEMDAPCAVLSKGHLIGGYEIIRRIGVGGMGEVYLANQKSMERKVALKILHDELASDNAYIQRFMREVRTLASVEHPSIVSAIEAGFDNGVYFLSMTYVEGCDLRKMLEDGRSFSEPEALKIAKKISEALRFAWEKHRIIHRDIKPANIMITPENEVKLMDLGIARHAKEDLEITNPGMMVGSPHYISPEQARSKRDIDFRSDMYSLGATLYHLLTGEAPFPGDNSITVLAALLTDERPDPKMKNAKLSGKTSSLIRKMMSKEADDRFQSWDDLIAEIDPILGNYEKKTSSARSNSVIFNNPRRIIIVALAFVIIFSLLVTLVKSGREDAKRKNAEKLYGEAVKFIEENPGPLKVLRKKLVMLEAVQRAGYPVLSAKAKERMEIIVNEARAIKEKADREKMESEFDEIRRKAYDYQKAGDIDTALKVWLNFKNNGPLKDDREYQKKMGREIDYLEGLKKKE